MGRVLQGTTAAAGLLAYGVSLAMPSGGQYLSLVGGVLVGWGVAGLVGLRSRRTAAGVVQASAGSLDPDAALSDATRRVLTGAGAEKPWTVVKRSGFSGASAT